MVSLTPYTTPSLFPQPVLSPNCSWRATCLPVSRSMATLSDPPANRSRSSPVTQPFVQ